MIDIVEVPVDLQVEMGYSRRNYSPYRGNSGDRYNNRYDIDRDIIGIGIDPDHQVKWIII